MQLERGDSHLLFALYKNYRFLVVANNKMIFSKSKKTHLLPLQGEDAAKIYIFLIIGRDKALLFRMYDLSLLLFGKTKWSFQ